jgi:SAM-dependent methyltransferase
MPRTKVASQPDRIGDVDWRHYDFLDLGAGRGGSLDYARRRFDAVRGVGVELKPERVSAARESGLHVVQGDATELGIDDKVRFVSMMDFLEHLPGLDVVKSTLAAAATAATDFLFIFHPSFEGEEYLAELGLALQWHRTRTHWSHIQVSDYAQMLDDLELRQYMVRYVKPILDSSHESVVHVDEKHPGFFDPATHLPKPQVRFARPVWRAQEIFVALRPLRSEDWTRITRAAGQSSLAAASSHG